MRAHSPLAETLVRTRWVPLFQFFGKGLRRLTRATPERAALARALKAAVRVVRWASESDMEAPLGYTFPPAFATHARDEEPPGPRVLLSFENFL